MNVISKTILLSSVFSLVMPVTSSASLSSGYISLVDTSQNQTFESKPTHYIKLAAVHFISNDVGFEFGGDTGNPGGQEFLPGDLCKQGGYSHEGCPAGYIKGEECPYDSVFVKECIDPETWCKDNGYNVTACSVPTYLTTSCPHQASLYKSCETDNIRACKEGGYSLTCETGKVGDSAQSCPYNTSYKKCICNPCSGFDYTSAQASAQGYAPGEVCNSCGVMKYKRTENKCDGFKACDCGGETNAKTCFSGTVKKFDSCKECCDTAKFIYDATNCTGSNKLSGSSCGGKFEKCQPPCTATPQIGDILYSDKTTCAAYLADKTPIGVVVDAKQKIAAGLLKSGTRWSRKDVDIPTVANLTTVTAVKNDNNAKTVTTAYVKYCESHDCGADTSEYSVSAWHFTQSYVVAGTQKYDWYLPSATLMLHICSNIDKINVGFKTLNDADFYMWGIDGTGYPSQYRYPAYSFSAAEAYQLAAEKSSSETWGIRCENYAKEPMVKNDIIVMDKKGDNYNQSIRLFYSF